MNKDRYIIAFETEAWANHLSLLSEGTVHVLEAVKMHVADLSEEEVHMFKGIPGVLVEKDAPVYLVSSTPSFVEKNPPSWGLDRIDQRSLPLDQEYKFDLRAAGADVDVYVVDTGVLAQHVEFGGRATFDANFAGDGKDVDCNGHGTHVASTIGGTVVGVAKQARIHGVKVLSCSGSGSLSTVIAGINYVVQQHVKKGGKSVINMSVGGGSSVVLNDAADAAVLAGITVVVAAGNSGQDACGTSPASAKLVVTVAASDKNDASASFTNYGPCTHVYAPGVDIYGAFIPDNSSYRTLSGTSMASPHVAGVATLILSVGAASKPAEVKAVITSWATPDVLKKVPAKTPSILLFVNRGESKLNY